VSESFYNSIKENMSSITAWIVRTASI